MYKYKCPTNNGYKKIKLTRNEHNKFLRNKRDWRYKYDYYTKITNNNVFILVEETPNKLASFLELLCIPISIAMYGISRLKEYSSDVWQTLIDPKEFGKHFNYDFEVKDKEFIEILRNN